MDVTTRDVTVVVDELVLDGVEPGEALVRDALHRALAPALGEHGLQTASGAAAAAVSRTVAQEAQ